MQAQPYKPQTVYKVQFADALLCTENHSNAGLLSTVRILIQRCCRTDTVHVHTPILSQAVLCEGK